MRKKLQTTKINVLVLISAIVPFFLLSGCTQQPTNPETNTVSIENLAFKPNTLTVSNGTTITWVNNDNVDHTVIEESSLFSSGMLTKGETFTYTFTVQGTYNYSYSIHPNMRGTIIVQ